MAAQHNAVAAFSSLRTLVTTPHSLSHFRFPLNCSTHTTFITHTRPRTGWAHPTSTQTIPLVNGDYLGSQSIQPFAINTITTSASSSTISTALPVSSTAESSETSGSPLLQTLYSESLVSSTRTDLATWAKLSSSISDSLTSSSTSVLELTSQSRMATTTLSAHSSTPELLGSATASISQMASHTLFKTPILAPTTTSRPSSTTTTAYTSASVASPGDATTIFSTISVVPTEASAQSAHQRMMPASKTIAIAACLGSALAIAIAVALVALFLLRQRRHKARTKEASLPDMISVVPSTPPNASPIISKPILLPAPQTQLPQVIKTSPVKSPDLRGSLQTNLNPAFLMPPSSAQSPASLDSWGTPNSATPAPSHLSYDSHGNVRRSDPFNLQHVGAFNAGH